MIKKITVDDFKKEFENLEFYKFTTEALEAMFEYYEELDFACNSQTVLDVKLICCSWSEYDNKEKFLKEFNFSTMEEAKTFFDFDLIELKNGNVLLLQE